MWNKKRSLLLSKIAVIIFMGLLAVIMFMAPQAFYWITGLDITRNINYKMWFLITVYSGGLVAALILYCLYRLLHNMGKGKIFVGANTRYLRIISWLCFAGAAISAASAVYFVKWCVIGAVAAFMGLIVRVIKNVIAEAIALKEENDYTI